METVIIMYVNVNYATGSDLVTTLPPPPPEVSSGSQQKTKKANFTSKVSVMFIFCGYVLLHNVWIMWFALFHEMKDCSAH